MTVDMTLCDNTNCDKRMRCYRYLEGMRQGEFEGMQSFFMWQSHEGECDLFIDVDVKGKEWWGI